MDSDGKLTYLTVKNWQRYQPRLKNGKPSPDKITLPTHLEDDPAFMSLSVEGRYLVIGIWRLKARTGMNPPNDPAFLHRALGFGDMTYHVVATYLARACHVGLLVVSNQQIDLEFARIKRDHVAKSPKRASLEPPSKTNGELFELAPVTPTPPPPPNSNGHAPSQPYSDAAIKIFLERFGRKPTWQTKDYVQLNALLKLQPSLTVETFARAYRRFVESADPFYRDQAGGLGFFCRAIDRFLPDPGSHKPAIPYAEIPD